MARPVSLPWNESHRTRTRWVCDVHHVTLEPGQVECERCDNPSLLALGMNPQDAA